jgi:UDP-glucose 4-epimerase
VRIGVVFPQVEIGQDPTAIRDYAHAVEALGYTHIAAWRDMRGITRVSIHTVGLGLRIAAEHVQALERFEKDLPG